MRREGIEYQYIGDDAYRLKLPEFDVILLQLSTTNWVASFRLGNIEIKALQFEAMTIENAFRKCEETAKLLAANLKDEAAA